MAERKQLVVKHKFNPGILHTLLENLEAHVRADTAADLNRVFQKNIGQVLAYLCAYQTWNFSSSTARLVKRC